MENFSAQWFLAYYVSLGALLISFGIYLLAKTNAIREYLIEAAGHDSPPSSWKSVLRYLLLFTIPCLILSFMPLSWVELLFSVWSLVIIYVGGQLILLWPHTAKAIIDAGDVLPRKIRIAAANMISIGIILFLLAYMVIQRSGG
jgi:hypothetical protein